MTVNQEVKGNLARLLATEDLVVEHKKVETACFNVHTRVLTLPMWEKASNGVYDMLVGHEVGHALYTPDEDWFETCKIPKQYVNVVEDVRVEKFMKRRYAGLNKTFYNGYKELSDQDFFALGDDDVDTYNFADRVNLYYKIGNFIDLKFSDEEKEILNLIGSAETFADVLVAAEVLYKYCKDEFDKEMNSAPMEKVAVNQSTNKNPGDQQNNQQEQNDQQDTQSSDQSGQQDTDGEMNEENNFENSGGHSFDPTIKTLDALEESIKDLVNNQSSETIYVELPKLNLDTVIVDNRKIHNECEISWKNSMELDDKDCFFVVDSKFNEFKKSSQKEVSYLVKEFECRKAADSYARATTARTGILDCTKLHTYKYNEDLFKKVTTLATGKNHGLVFVLDWSGSMSDVLMDTLKQLYNLIWFCKKVNIPFEVYAFTNDWRRVQYDENGKAIIPKPHYKKKAGLVCVEESFSLLNLFTSKVSGSVIEKQMKNIFRVAYTLDRASYNYYTRYSIPHGLGLSGTPLNQSLIALFEILPKFQKENKLQKVQCVVLTDGEGEWVKTHVELNRRWESEPYIGLNCINCNTVLRDRKLGTVYSMNNGAFDFTDTLLRNLRDKFPSVNFIGMRIVNSRDVGNFIRKYNPSPNEYIGMMASWKKNKSFSIKSSGYTSYFGISSSTLNSSTEFKVEGDATKVQIKSAFVKSLNSKKMNKKILNEFVDLIC